MKVLPFVLSAALQAILLRATVPHYLPEYPFYWLFLCLTTLNLSLWAIYKVEIYPHFLSPLRHLPSPKGGYPFIGHGLSQFRNPRGEEYLQFLKDTPNDGIIHFRGLFNSNQLLLTSSKALAEVLVSRPYDFEKPEKNRGFLRRILGDGLVVTEGDVHKYQRKHMLPSFSFRHIKNLYPTFWSKSVDLTRSITAKVFENHADPSIDSEACGVTDISYWATKATLDVIGIAGLGRDFNTLKNSDDELVKNYEEVTATTLELVVLYAAYLIGPQWLLRFLPWDIDKRFTTATDSLRRICRQFVQEKKELLKMESEESIDVLSQLMKSNDFSDDELVDQLLTIIAAGHDTTSSSFTWATYLLAAHPAIQSRLRAEIRSAIPYECFTSSTTGFDFATALESLPVLNAVCNETLRLIPTVPMTARIAKQATTILNHPVPAGTHISIIPWAINRSSDFWGPTAESFNPDRWIDAETGRPNNTGGAASNYSIITFLHGPRSCIGQGFAKAELRALLAAFVGVFEMEMANPKEIPVPAGIITVKPQGGLLLKLRIVGE